MLTVTLKNTEQKYSAKLTLESKAQMLDLWSAKQVNNETSYVFKQPKQADKNAVTNRPASLQNKAKVKSSYWILVTVILLHLLVITAFFTSKADEVKVIEIKPMTVSLLSETTIKNEPVLQKLMPLTQKYESEKQTKNPEQIQTKAETQTKTTKVEAEVINQAVAQATESKPVSSESADNLAKVEHQDKATSHEKPVDEQVIEQPKFDVAYLNNPAPLYPKMSRRQGEQGRVLLKVLVSENGTAEQVELDTSSGYEKLDQAAIDAVKKWSFVPAKRSNQAISAYVLVPVKFSLNS